MGEGEKGTNLESVDIINDFGTLEYFLTGCGLLLINPQGLVF